MMLENIFAPPVLVSACLYGCNCRYDGKSKPEDRIVSWVNSGARVIFICPEQQGGQPTPRPDAEIVGGDGQKMIKDILEEFGGLSPEIIIQESNVVRVKEINGTDVTKRFLEGARLALVLAKASECKVAILKSNSPSCGTETIYDGTFQKKLVLGIGVTAAWLKNNGIKVYNEQNCPFLPS